MSVQGKPGVPRDGERPSRSGRHIYVSPAASSIQLTAEGEEIGWPGRNRRANTKAAHFERRLPREWHWSADAPLRVMGPDPLMA